MTACWDPKNPSLHIFSTPGKILIWKGQMEQMELLFTSDLNPPIQCVDYYTLKFCLVATYKCICEDNQTYFSPHFGGVECIRSNGMRFLWRTVTHRYEHTSLSSRWSDEKWVAFILSHLQGETICRRVKAENCRLTVGGNMGHPHTASDTLTHRCWGKHMTI